MYNKKALRDIVKNLGSAKAPTKKRDIIYDPMGQWTNPGQDTRVPTSNGNITMGANPETGQPIPFPVFAQPNVGPGVMMQPGQDYTFPGAKYVDEFPQVKKGGLVKQPKKYSKSLMAKNILFVKNAFINKKKSVKNKIFDPNSPYFQDGGTFEIELDDAEIDQYKQGGYIVEELDAYAKGGSSSCPKDHVWDSNTKKCVKVYTLANDKKLIDGVSNWAMQSNDPDKITPEYNDQIKHYLYSGAYGYDPITGTLHKLKKDQKTVADAETKKILAKQDDKAAYTQSIIDAGFDPDTFGKSKGTNVITGEEIYGDKSQEDVDKINKEAVNDFVTEGHRKAILESPFNTAAFFTPAGMAAGVMQGAANLLPDAYDFAKDPSWSGAGAVGMDALMMSPAAKGLGKALGTDSGLLSKTYKINPWAFKANPNSYYRGIGRSGLNDALETQQLRTANKMSNFGEDLYLTSDFKLASGNYSKDKIRYKENSLGDFDAPLEKILPKDSRSYIAEIPKSALTNPVELPNLFVNNAPIIKNRGALPLDNIKLYKQHWRKGYQEVPKELPGSPNASDNVQKAGFLNPLALIDRVTPRPPSPTILLGMEDDVVNWSPLNLIPGYGKKLAQPGFTYPINSGNTEITAYRKFGNSLDDLKNSKTFRPQGGFRMGANQIKKEGNWAESGIANENYKGVFAAGMDPRVAGTNIQLQRWSKRNGVVGMTKQGSPAIPITDPGFELHRRLPFSNKYVPINKQKLIDNKFQLATQLPHVQSLIEKYGIAAGYGLISGYLANGKEGAVENLKTINKYSVDPIINWSKTAWGDLENKLNQKEEGGYIDLELDEDQINEYKEGGYIVEDINEYKEGGALLTKKVTCKNCGWTWDAADGGNDMNTCHKCGGQGLIHAKYGGLNKFVGGGPTDCGEGMVWDEATQQCVKNTIQAVDQVRMNQYSPYITAYEQAHPRGSYVYQKKADYLRKYKGLNRSAGVTQDNFNTDVENNFNKNWEYDRNSAVIAQYAKDHGFNPNNHVQLVEQMADKGLISYDMAANSKYGSKLKPSLWARTASGIQELGNAVVKGARYTLTGKAGKDVFNKQIKSLTKKENEERHNNPMGALEVFAIGDLPGAVIMNAARDLSTASGGNYQESPGILSGELKSNVSEGQATLANIPMYMSIGTSMAKLAAKSALASKTTSAIGKIDDVTPLLTKVDDVNPLTKVEDARSVQMANNKVSEIDWSKWNKEIPKNKPLMQEYNTIEETSKANGTWMKNADGTPFDGTPEQFVQQQSSNFKKAYPEGTTTTYRGDATHIPTLINKNSVGNAVFTGEEDLAKHYTGNTDYYNSNIFSTENKIIPKDQWDSYSEAMKNSTLSKYGDNLKIVDNASDPGLTPAGMHKLYVKNSDNQVIIDAKNADWHSIENPFSENIRIDKQLGERTKDYAKQGDYVNTDQIARVLEEQGIDKAIINNIQDGKLGNILINNQKPGNYLKSMMGNSGMFDLNNPNIYKAIIPAVGGTGLMLNNPGVLPQQNKYGGLHKFEEEGMILDLSPEEIEEYKKGGYVIEDISVPSLTRMDNGAQVKGSQGLNPDFSTNLTAFINAAKADGIDLGIGSGFRTVERQKQLWEQALKKYGSPEKARKWVAPPGRSNHNRGTAVDLNSSGAFLGKNKNTKATQWAHANAEKFGLHFRMGHEPWHIEPLNLSKEQKAKIDAEHQHSDNEDPNTHVDPNNAEALSKEGIDMTKYYKNLGKEPEITGIDNDYSNWNPQEEVVVDPRIAQLNAYSKLMAPSIQNVNDMYAATKINQQQQQKQFAKGGYIDTELTDREIANYKNGGYIVEYLD